MYAARRDAVGSGQLLGVWSMIVPLTPLTFYRRAEELFGAKIGVVDGEERFSYADFARRVERLAGALRGLGVVRGDVVSFLDYNSHHLLEGYYAVPQLGAILNPLNIRLFPAELAYILEHAEAKVLCFHRELLPVVEALRPQLRREPRLVVLEGDPAALPFAALEYEALLEQATPFQLDPDTVDEDA